MAYIDLVLVFALLNYCCHTWPSTGVTALEQLPYLNIAWCDKGWSLGLVSGVYSSTTHQTVVANNHIHTFSSKCNSIFSCWIWGEEQTGLVCLLIVL